MNTRRRFARLAALALCLPPLAAALSGCASFSPEEAEAAAAFYRREIEAFRKLDVDTRALDADPALRSSLADTVRAQLTNSHAIALKLNTVTPAPPPEPVPDSDLTLGQKIASVAVAIPLIWLGLGDSTDDDDDVGYESHRRDIWLIEPASIYPENDLGQPYGIPNGDRTCHYLAPNGAAFSHEEMRGRAKEGYVRLGRVAWPDIRGGPPVYWIATPHTVFDVVLYLDGRQFSDHWNSQKP